MVVRKRKKKNKLRGKRTHGKGNTKNKRGAGCRGGRGKAGSHKHKYSKYYTEFGVKKRLKPKTLQKKINLDELNELIPGLIEEKKVEVKGNEVLLERKNLEFEKILGKGEIDFKLHLIGIKVSENARKKIEGKGGKIE